MLTGLCLICIVLFVDETYYNRRIPASERPVPKSRLMRLIGVEQWKSRNQRSTFYQAFMRPWQVIVKPTVLLSMTYYMFTFAWVVGINTTLSIFLTPLYNFGLRQIGTSSLLLLSLISAISARLIFNRLLLLHPRRRGPPRRDSRPLAARSCRPYLHATALRRSRTRSPAVRTLDLHAFHRIGSRAPGVLSRAWVPLHDLVSRLGPLRIRNYDHNCRDREL